MYWPNLWLDNLGAVLGRLGAVLALANAKDFVRARCEPRPNQLEPSRGRLGPSWGQAANHPHIISKFLVRGVATIDVCDPYGNPYVIHTPDPQNVSRYTIFFMFYEVNA